MKVDRSLRPKLRAAERVWHSFHPECSVSGGLIGRGSLSFKSTRMLGAGVEASWWIEASKVDDNSCSLRVRMGLHDERVNALRTIAMGYDVSIHFLEFDVLSVSAVMDGQETPNEPLIDSNSSVEELVRVVGDYSRRIDRIWNFVGGPGVQGLERLAIWVLRENNEGAVRHAVWHAMVGDVSAAFAYQEKELAHRLIAKRLSELDEATQLDLPDYVLDIYDEDRLQFERLQEAVGLLPGA